MFLEKRFVNKKNKCSLKRRDFQKGLALRSLTSHRGDGGKNWKSYFDQRLFIDYKINFLSLLFRVFQIQGKNKVEYQHNI